MDNFINFLFRWLVRAALYESGLQDQGLDPLSYTLAAQVADGARIHEEMRK